MFLRDLRNLMKKDNNLFYRFLFSYVIVLLIPVVIGTLIYTEISRTVKAEIFDKNITILKQTSETVDSYIQQIEKNVQILSMSPYFDNIAINALSNDSAVYYDKWKIIEQLKLYRVMNNYIIDILVYPKDCGFVITRISSYDKDLFYSEHFKYDGMDNKEWDQFLRSNYFRNKFLSSSSLFISGEYYDAIPYIESIPTVNPNTSNGAIVVLINCKPIKDMINNIGIGKKGWVEIIDKEGNNILLIKGSGVDSVTEIHMSNCHAGAIERKVNGKKMIISAVTSPNNQWTYTAYVPSEYALRNINYARILIYIYMLLSLLVGLLTASWFSHFNQKPIKEIILSITKFNKSDSRIKDDFEFVKDSFKNLITDNTQLKEKIEKQLPIIKAAFHDRLLKGHYTSVREIEAVLSHIDFDFNGKWFEVAILKILLYEDCTINLDIISELNIKRAMISDMLPKIITNRIHTHYLDEDKIVILGSYEQYDINECKAYVEQFAHKIKDIMYEEYNIEILIGLGNFYANATDISYSFNEAMKVIEGFNIGRKVVWFTEIPKVNNMYYYPVNVETKLIHLVKQNDTTEVNKILKDLYYENFFKRKLSPEMGWLFIDELLGTLIKIIDKDEMPQDICEIFTTVKNKYSLDNTYEKIIQVFEVTCDAVNIEKKHKRKQLVDGIVNYVDTNFTDPSLSLADVSELFKIGESVISLLFKEATGETFSSYIERKRINSACEIINGNTNTNINEIAAKVGYTNDTTFRRAFKRVVGLNPRDYRNDIIV